MTDTFFQQVEEKMLERLTEVKSSFNPNTFSVFLRKGAGDELEFEDWVYEEVSRRSDLPTEWSDHSTEFEFRSHHALWEVEKEFLFSTNLENRQLLISPNDRRNLPSPRNDTPSNYTYTIVENIPLALKPYTHILDFQLWGETLYFDYDRMKSDALDTYMKNKDLELLNIRYEEIEILQKLFPNTYVKDYTSKCVRISDNEPRELTDERHHRSEQLFNLLATDEARAVIQAIEEFNARFPENTQEREGWNNEVLLWYEGIQNQDIRNLVVHNPNRRLTVRWH